MVSLVVVKISKDCFHTGGACFIEGKFGLSIVFRICSVDSDMSVDSVMSEFSESVVVISRDSLTGVNPKMEAGLGCRGLKMFGDEILGTRGGKLCSGLLHSSMLFAEDIGRNFE